jgi:hypothetical protein
MSVSLEDQIACVAREIAMRKVVYPRRVAAGQMKQSQADLELARMNAVLETLTTTRAAWDESVKERRE